MLNPANTFRTIQRTVNPCAIIMLVPILLLLATACSSDTGNPIISSEIEPGGPEYSGVVITQDIAVGRNRLLFVVIDREGMPVKGASPNVGVYFLTPKGDTRELKQTVNAKFVAWSTAAGGVFSTEIDLIEGGLYQLDINLTSSNGVEIFAQTNILVQDDPQTPAIGTAAPASVTYKAGDKEDLSQITSALIPDPDLYQLSINEALQQGKPLVVVFATPAFCVSATCGPQLEELAKVKDVIGTRANFIHVDVFEDPHLIEGGRPTGDLVPAVLEWGLPTEPWTFIVDKNGLISAKFEQLATATEIETKLLEIL